MPTVPAVAGQSRNPLHGLTLSTILESLVQRLGWSGLAERVELRCFSQQPSLNSSLKVLRKNLWAREKVEALYLSLEAENGVDEALPRN